MPRKQNRKKSNPPARLNKHANLDVPLPRLDEQELYPMLQALIEEKKQPLVLILDCVEDPHNLGACMRTADAAGVCAVIAPKDKSVAITDTVRLVASGATEQVPFTRVTNLARVLTKLQDLGFWLVGTDDKGDRTLYELDLRGPIGIVMGAEGKGMRRLTAEGCDFLVRIPMAGTVECLNVSVAAGVCLYETVRQRSFSGTS